MLHPGRANVPKVRLRTTQIARRVLGFCFVSSFQRAGGVPSIRAPASADLAPPIPPENPQKELQDKLAKMYDVSDNACVSLFGFRTQFGGGKSTGFGLIYDTVDAVKKFEPKHRVRRQLEIAKVTKSRKQIKEKKNRVKKLRGGAKRKVL